MNTNCEWNIYLPIQCLSEKSGYLVGTYDSKLRYICITGLQRSVQSKDTNNLKFVGIWIKGPKIEYHPNMDKQLSRLYLNCDNGVYPRAHLDPPLYDEYKNTPKECLVILYDCESLTQSYTLMCNSEKHPEIVCRLSHSLKVSYKEMPMDESSTNFACTQFTYQRLKEKQSLKFLIAFLFKLLFFIKTLFHTSLVLFYNLILIIL